MKYIILSKKKLKQFCVLHTRVAFIFLMLIVNLFISSCRSLSCEHKWTTSPLMTAIPDSLQNEAAVIILNERELSNIFKTYNFSEESNYSRIKLQTTSAISDFSTFEIFQMPGMRIIELDARTLKPDGRIIDLNSGSIKKLSSENENNYFNFSTLKFSIPGVDVGDEIEIYYKTRNYSLMPYYRYYFHLNAPVLKSNFNYRFTKNIKNKIVMDNHLTKPLFDTLKNIISCKWELNNLRSLKDQNNCIISKELPNLRLSILSMDVILSNQKYGKLYYYEGNQPVNNFTWADYNSLFIESIKDYVKYNNVKRVDKIDSVLNRINANFEDTIKFNQFLNVCKYIYDSVTVVEQLDSNNLRVWRYLADKKINKLNLYKLYRKLFNYYDIDYYICYANNKQKGDVDMQFSIIDSFTDVFFSVKQYTYSNMYYIYPSDHIQKFGLNELPINIKGTSGIILSEQNTFSKSIINQGDASDNFKTKYGFINISPDSNLVYLRYNTVFSGTISTLSRSIQKLMVTDDYSLVDNFKENILRDNPNAIIDTLIIEKAEFNYPNKFNLSLNLTEPNILSTIDSNTYSLNLNTLLNHNIIPYQTTKRWLDFYTDFPYKDNYFFNLNYKLPFEILNADNLITSLENNVGSYNFKIVQVSPTQFDVQSAYIIKYDYVSKEKYNQIEDLNKAFQKIKNASLIIKVKH